jgi:hypothetical protein
MPAQIVKLAPNVPVSVRVVFCDVVEGQYGHQLKMKGEVKGVSPTAKDLATVYVPVDLAADLVRGGWVPEQHTLPDGTPGEAYKSPNKGQTWWVVEKKQAAGEKYAKIEMRPEAGWPDEPAPQLNESDDDLPANVAPRPAPTPAPAQKVGPDAGYAKIKALEASADECLDWTLAAAKLVLGVASREMEAALAADKPIPDVKVDLGQLVGSLFGTRFIAKQRAAGL